MPTEDSSPSAGWREVYDAMGADPGDGDDLRADGYGEIRVPEACPDCGAIPGVEGGDLCCEGRGGVGAGSNADPDAGDDTDT
ncbi:hypothetical protein ACFO0N_17095 [Halobium salinum]|uniref:Uncharacterized protein n=1 Tax=Halobium salinum TaxID=1364940 RepID=A0ABD5PG01_9EURY|nr:hypothetical protein [Halobium salinum]